MTRTVAVNVAIAALTLLAIAAAQTRTQNQPGQAGRYQLLSAQYRWPEIDAEHKMTFDDRDHLFRIDTATGETSILLFISQEDRNGQLQSFWSPVGRVALPNK